MEGYCNNGAIHGLYKRLPPQGWGDIRQLTFKGTTHLVKAKWVVAFITWWVVAFITWTHIRETHIRELGKYYWGIRSSILEDSITLSSQLLVVRLFNTTANILQPTFLCKRIIQIYWASNKVSTRTGVISSHNSKSHSHGSSKIAINLFTRACYLPNGRAWNGLYWQDYSFFLVQKVRLRVRWRSKLLGLPVLLEQGWRDEVCRGQTEAERLFSTGKGHCWTVWDIPRDLGGHFHRMSRCGQVARRSQIGKIIFGDSSWYYHI